MTGEMLWWVDNDNIVVALDNGDGTYTAPSESGLNVRVYCTKEWDDIDTTASALHVEDALPSAFHMDIVNGVIADCYMLPGKQNQRAAEFEYHFRAGVARAQEYASRERTQDGVRPASCFLFGVDE